MPEKAENAGETEKSGKTEKHDILNQPDEAAKSFKPISMSTLKMLVSSLVFLFIAQITHNICTLMAMDYYTNPVYFSIWSPLMMSLGGNNPNPYFFYVSIGFGLISAILFVVSYTILGKGLKGGPAARGAKYGMLIFLVAAVPSSLSMILLLNMPEGLIMLWTVENLLIYIVGGLLIGSILVASTPKEARMKTLKKEDHDSRDRYDTEPEWMKQSSMSKIELA